MKSYEIYLTKNADVAHLLFDGAQTRLGKDGVTHVTSGIVDSDDVMIPSIYKNYGYWYVAITIESERPTMRVIVA